MWPSGKVVVETLRALARGAGDRPEALALRLRLSHLLGTGDLRPPGMPPSAILLVRRLRDPRPGGIAGPGAFRMDPAWEREVQRALADCWRLAARPVRGEVPEDVEAVLFSDPAELIAGIALSMARGLHMRRWWCQAVLRGLPALFSTGMAELLGRDPEYLPAVLEQLAGWGKAEAVLGAIRRQEALPLAHKMGEAFGLSPNLLDALPAVETGAGTGAGAARAPGRALDRDPPDQPAPAPRTRPGVLPAPAVLPALVVLPAPAPWEALLPPGSMPQGLGPERAALLGLGLALVRAPAAARSAGFARALRRWAASANGGGVGPTSHVPVPTSHVPVPTSHVPVPTPHVPVSTSHVPVPTPHVPVPTPHAPVPAPHVPVPTPHVPVPTPHVPVRAQSPANIAAAVTSEGLPFSGGVATQLGGVLYLVNPLQELDLPRTGPPGLGAWALLEAIGRALLGPDLADLAADPLWAALAGLDGRPPGTLPGEALPPWLTRILPALRDRLTKALGPPGDLTRQLLLAPGRLYITTTHVDLVLPLEAISLSVRLAGLDRSPGWAPDFGRVILFHYQ